MHAIILFSHGSVLCGAGETLFALARRMESRGDAPIVEAGFLNYSEPTFEAAFEKCVERGATHITIAPYFLVAGYFVKVSLPPKIAVMTERFPDVEVKVAEALKTHELLADAIVHCAERAQEPEKWRDILNTAPQFCRDNPQCPHNGTPKCPKRPTPRESMELAV
jgi:sirohydrochlorin ferrochelatase